MTVGATFCAMGAQENRRADHAPYIAAVRRSIETHDVRVTDVRTTTSGDGRREATLTLRPDDAAFAERVPGEASASWDEDNGWSLLARRESLASHVHKGLGVVPDPEDVAAWAVVLLAHPELTPSYEDQPFRDHSTEDPGFEARLAAYAPRA
jgi:hypothetical protein